MILLALIPGIGAALNWVVLIAAAVAAMFAIYKTVIQPVRRWYNKWDNGMDTLVGYPAITDKTGTQLKAPTPPLANRVEALEQTILIVANTQNKLSDLERDLASISVQLQQNAEQGTAIIDEWTEWRRHHEAEASKRNDEIQQIFKMLAERTS